MTEWLGMGVAPRAPRPDARSQVLARAYGTGHAGRPRLALALAAAALLVVAASLVTLRSLQQLRGEVAQLRDSLSRAAWDVPGTRVVAIPVTTNGRPGALTVQVDSASGRWVVTCFHLTANAPTETYQLWFVTDSGLQNAALMPMPSSDPMSMSLEVPAGVRGLAMSLEPRGGSPVPSGPIFFRRDL